MVKKTGEREIEILELLKERSMSATEIFARTHMNYYILNDLLKQLEQQGFIVSFVDGKSIHWKRIK